MNWMRIMQAVHLPQALKHYVVVALLAASCAFDSRGIIVPTLESIDRVPQTSAPLVTAGNLWLIFVDDLHLDFPNTGRLRDLLRTISRE
jgi:hypothetical protein